MDLPSAPQMLYAGLVGGVTFPAVLASAQLAVFKPLGMTYRHGNKLASLVGGVAVFVAGFTASVTVATSLELLQRSTQSKTKLKISKNDVLLSSISSVVIFRSLGGRFSRVLPSSLLNPGAYSRDWVPATYGMQHANTKQREAIQSIGQRYGCHSCGRKRGVANFIADHQPPSKTLVAESELLTQRFFPQCEKCSSQQGGLLANNNYASNSAHVKPHPLSLRVHHIFLPLPILFACLRNGNKERNKDPVEVTNQTNPATVEMASQTTEESDSNKRTLHRLIRESNIDELVGNFPLLIVWKKLVDFVDSFSNPSDSFHVTLWSFIIIAAWGTL